ncbi:MAG TPA: sugar nucleotide-binding protein [Verrucomicrobiae bacterium]|jgi:UDP-glucose 4,6-dehydratase|nr:sugar nucleotide-binding protein [Verrucomicrobiae bacterium]
MIVLLGSTGYVGQQFADELQRRDWPFVAPKRAQTDYTRFDVLRKFLAQTKPEFLINAAGYTGKPNVDSCEIHRADTLQGNTLFPAMLAHACESLDIPFGHVSSGCIYTGAKILRDGNLAVEADLVRPAVRAVLEKDPGALRGFTEEDEPNFSFRRPPCSFYSGTKALGEENVHGIGRNYIWRLRIPFDEQDNPRNYLSKVQNYSKVYDNINSLSHRADFVAACLDLWARRAPFGIYNVTNPGFVTTRHVISLIQEILRPARPFEFWASDEEFYRVAAKTPRSNCVLDTSKLTGAGVQMRPVEEALRASLQAWKPLAV